MLIVNGPIRRQLEMVATFNALGNTDRASAAVGRAIRLGLINLLDVGPVRSTVPPWATPENSLIV